MSKDINEFNNLLKKELSKIPFDLFSIINNFIFEENTKVAIVGGYVRDILINKIHNKELVKTNDLDIVIEGSAIKLAKYIKKNIKNVNLCLIKEFALFNTVEINVNNFKIDIASTRKEVYLSPGTNPKVSSASLIEDLKRRDFSINSIAFEISENKIYDLFEGIKHIKNKELHLLHKNSIRDDPSRVIRGAKYASRLGFKMSESSLNQSQEIVKEWPWQYYENNSIKKLPQGIGIRIRMELSEIFKSDNLSKIIFKLNEWKLTSLINSDLKVNDQFNRGLKWIQKLKGNKLLYLAKDSESLEYFFDRFLINSKDQKILKDFKYMKKYLIEKTDKFQTLTPSGWTRIIEERDLKLETIKLIISDRGKYWKYFYKWLFIYRFIKSSKSGNDLIEEGWASGKTIGDELKRLRYLEIDKN